MAGVSASPGLMATMSWFEQLAGSLSLVTAEHLLSQKKNYLICFLQCSPLFHAFELFCRPPVLVMQMKQEGGCDSVSHVTCLNTSN